jgi:DNA-binding MarR family transcriptional regulator
MCLDNSRYNDYSVLAMKKGAHKAKQIGSREEKVVLELLRTIEFLSRRFAELLKSEDLSQTQYNVLRILRGAPEGLSCGEIGNRLITRDPDITRLLDRMEKRGLISRARDDKDRRLVLTRLTGEGFELVDRMDEPVLAIHHDQMGHLGPRRLKALSDLLRVCRRESP